MTKSIKVLTIISILVFSASFYTFPATASWCDHEGSILVSSTQAYIKVDDVKHKIVNTVVRECTKCLQNYEIIDELGYEAHYKFSTTDGGHGVGQIHDFKEMCICSQSQMVSFTCYGPPCVTISSEAIIHESPISEKNLPVLGNPEQECVESVISELFNKKLLTLRMETIDYDEIFTDASISDINYFQDKLSYQQSLYAFSGRIPESHQLSIEIVSCDLTDDTATAEVIETIKFRYINSDEPSYERIYYTVELIKNADGRWLISKVQSSDEFDEMFYESGFDLKSLQADILAAASIRDAIIEDALFEDSAVDSVALPNTGQSNVNAVLSIATYDVNSVVVYAASYALN